MPDEKKKSVRRRKTERCGSSAPSNYREIPVARIRGNKWNPRSSGFDGPKFDELVASIRQKGVIQPIVVRSIQEENFDFEILAGGALPPRHEPHCLSRSHTEHYPRHSPRV